MTRIHYDTTMLGQIVDEVRQNPAYLDDDILQKVRTPTNALVALKLLTGLMFYPYRDGRADSYLEECALQYLPHIIEHFIAAPHVVERCFDLLEMATDSDGNSRIHIGVANIIRQSRPVIDGYALRYAPDDLDRAVALVTRINRLTLAGQRSPVEKVRAIYRTVARDRRSSVKNTFLCEAVIPPPTASRPGLAFLVRLRDAVVRAKATP